MELTPVNPLLIRILTGAIPPDRGELDIAGQRVRFGDALTMRRAGVRVVYQEFTLVPDLSLAENVFLGRERGPLLLDRSAMRTRPIDSFVSWASRSTYADQFED